MCYSPITIKNPSKHFNGWRDQLKLRVPCGKCLECRMQKKTEMYHRALYEYKFCKDNDGLVLFFTLTYNPENLPLVNFIHYDLVETYDCIDTWIFDENDNPIRYTGCQTNCIDHITPARYLTQADIDEDKNILPPNIYPLVKPGDLRLFPSFSVPDVQSFIHKYRQHLKRNFAPKFKYDINFNDSIKYLITMEYGDKTNRPHYHGLLYFRDLFYAGQSNVEKIEIIKWLKDAIVEKWDKGFVSFGKLPKQYVDGIKQAGVVYDERALLYVTKYVCKDLEFHINSKISEFKVDTKNTYFRTLNLTPENYKSINSKYHDISLFSLDVLPQDSDKIYRYSPRCLNSLHFGERMFWYLSTMDKINQCIQVPVRKYDKEGNLKIEEEYFYLPNYLRRKMNKEKACHLFNGLWRFDFDKLSPFGQQTRPFFEELCIKNLQINLYQLLCPTNIPEDLLKKYGYDNAYSFCDRYNKLLNKFNFDTIAYFYVNLRYFAYAPSFDWDNDLFIRLPDGKISLRQEFKRYYDNQKNYFLEHFDSDDFTFHPMYFVNGFLSQIEQLKNDSLYFRELNDICNLYDDYRSIRLQGRRKKMEKLEENYQLTKQQKRALGVITNLYNF